MKEHYLNYKKKIKKQHFVLKHLLDFIHEETKNKKFIYHLENGKQFHLKLEKDQIPHLMGLHHFNVKTFKPLKGAYAVEQIEKESLKSSSLMGLEEKFIQMKDRLFHCHSIPKILSEADCLKFDATKVKLGDSLFSNLSDITLFLQHPEINLCVYLGFKKKHDFNQIYIFNPATFLVDRKKNYSKGTESIKIKKIEIIELD